MNLDRTGAWASYANAVLALLLLAVGVVIGVRLGAASGAEVANAAADALRSVRPLLLSAEILKVASATALALAVGAVARRYPPPLIATLAGYAAALFLLAAGLFGVLAVGQLSQPTGTPAMGRAVALLGMASLPLTGVWALLAAQSVSAMPRWLIRVAWVLATASFAVLVLPPVGLVFGLASIAWWIGLGRHFAARARPDPV